MLDRAEVVALRPLSIVAEGDEYVVGCPATGVFVTMPEVGVRAIQLLQQGGSAAEISHILEAEQGEDVDIDDFLSTLEQLGFLADEPASPPETDGADRLAPRIGRILFSRTAWLLYALSFLASVGILALRPDFFPRPTDILIVDNVLLSLIVLAMTGNALAAVHELSHYLAARALGIRATFSVGRRFYFMVYETDLTELWSRPRRQRYGPQLAGLATDSLVLCTTLAGLLIVGDDKVLALIVFLKVFTMGWQCFVFMRTDLYGVLTTALGCRALWRAKTLELSRRFGRLSQQDSDEYASLHPRDRAVARWFSLVYLAGLVVAATYFVYFFVPGTIRIARWTGGGFGSGPTSWYFWQACLTMLLTVGPTLVALTILVRERISAASTSAGSTRRPR